MKSFLVLFFALFPFLSLALEAPSYQNFSPADRSWMPPSFHGSLEERLQETWPDVDKRDGLGRTPLHIAVFYGDIESAKLLLEKGANIDARENWDRTPLHLASAHGQDLAVEFLLVQGADPKLTNKWMHTPLHLAETIKTVELLITKTDPNARDALGMTPIHLASVFGDVELFMPLIKGGADPYIKDAKDRTAFDVAKNTSTKVALKQALSASNAVTNTIGL